MTSESSESKPVDPAPATSRSDGAVVLVTSIAVVTAVFGMFFFMGFVSAWLQREGDLMALFIRGLKVGASGTIGVICIGLSAKSWQRISVPPWLPSTASFAAGFFVMNGLGEAFDGRYESILPKAGGGFLSGCLAGFGLYWVQKKGWFKPSAVDSTPRGSATE